MSFIDFEIKREYRNLEKNIVQNFFMPLMSEAVLYRRAVGFFSSTALACYSIGITQLIKNGGKIELIASPALSEEDIEAINKGYELREDVIERRIIDSLSAPLNIFQQERLNLLATYIADEKLELKIAVVDSNSRIGVYHEKLGLLYDSDGNVVSFSGSMNESANGFIGNYETIDVFSSWADPERIADKEAAFTRIWENMEAGVCTKRFPNVEKAILDRYKRNKVDLTVDEEEYSFVFNKEAHLKKNLENTITMSDDTLYPYQNEAIDEWEKREYRGIFDMCTGAGKTYTAIGAIKRLHDKLDGCLATIIVAPYQHLVEQWVDDLENFNIHPIVGYSGRKQPDYRKNLKAQIFDYNLGAKKSLYFICTNATYKTSKVQELIRGLHGNVLLVVDEAHNFGTKGFLATLLPQFQYRLALSATIERHGDEEGTQGLYAYFGEKCYEYTLERAISEKKLTEYYYRPYIVELSEKELEEYTAYSIEIKKNSRFDKKGKLIMTKKLEQLMIDRARVTAGAVEKGKILQELIEPYRDDNHMLIYCGATTLSEEGNEDYGIECDIRQIDYITKLIGENMSMNVSQFTSRENMKERLNLISRFKEGTELQGLVAIKCLDEGVNIPSIKTAFILASTTNPKEYIQRRGRVLRTFPGKEYAEIYDLVTIPRPLAATANLSEEELALDRSLIRNELRRIYEFKRLSLNPYDSNKIIDMLVEAYDIDIEDYSTNVTEDDE